MIWSVSTFSLFSGTAVDLIMLICLLIRPHPDLL